MRLDTIAEVAAAVRGRRAELGLSQDDLARRAYVSRKWVVELENGKATAELGLVLRVLDALELTVEASPRQAGTSPNLVDDVGGAPHG